MDRHGLFSAQFSLSHACWLLTYPLAGLLGAALDLTATAALLAALATGALLVGARVWRDPEVIEHATMPWSTTTRTCTTSTTPTITRRKPAHATLTATATATSLWSTRTPSTSICTTHAGPGRGRVVVTDRGVPPLGAVLQRAAAKPASRQRVFGQWLVCSRQ